MQYAHNPEDLHANLVLGERGYLGICNLDNDIHPLWRHSNFRVGDIAEQVRLLETNDSSWDRSTLPLDQRIYQRMEPGLRLATLLLEQSGPFFSQLMHGQLQSRQIRKIEPLGDVKDWRIRWTNVVENPHFPSHVIAGQLRTFADHVTENSLIYFPIDKTGTGAWADTRATFKDRCRCRYAIGIGSLLADVICQPQWHRTSAQGRRYYNFQLALTLVHELAHVAWRCRRYNDIIQDPDTENDEVLLWPNEEQIELGQSWEYWFFGGELQAIDTFERPPRWLGFGFGPFTIDSGNERSIDYPDCRLGTYAIPAVCINQFFQKQRWADHTNGSASFQIRLTPSNSLTNEHWGGTIDAGFDGRLAANHDPQSHPRPRFLEEW